MLCAVSSWVRHRYAVGHRAWTASNAVKEKRTLNKRLTLDDRKKIESGLRGGQSFKQIGTLTGKDCTSISREVRNHLVVEQTGACGQRFNECLHRFGCQHRNLCEIPECKGGRCCTCRLIPCRKVCEDFERQVCPKLSEPPYVCNGCTDRKKCSLEKHLYKAVPAQQEADAVRSESRAGTHLAPKELAHVRNVVAPLLKKGQSLHHIWAANKDTLMVSERTLYSLVGEGGILADCTLDLRQKVSRKPVKPRYKTQKHEYKVDPECKQGRHFEEYEQHMAQSPRLHHVQMDTVEGEVGSKVILTIHFVEAQFMMGFLRDRNDARSVRDIFNDLTDRLGLEVFRELFPVILTDNGSEFSDPLSLEVDPRTNEPRTRIFYCHPYSSFEKGAVEQNHRLMRYVLPKRKSSFDGLTQEKVNLMMSHVNSYLRAGRSDICAFDLFRAIHDPQGQIVDALNLVRVEPNDVFLKPDLLKQM